jgi:hypothetical protein
MPTGISEWTGTRPPAIDVRTVPNPAQGEIRFLFFLDSDANVVLDIYDVAGRLVGRIRENGIAAEWNSINIGRGADQIQFKKSGVYFYRLTAGNHTATGKFTIVR